MLETEICGIAARNHFRYAWVVEMASSEEYNTSHAGSGIETCQLTQMSVTLASWEKHVYLLLESLCGSGVIWRGGATRTSDTNGPQVTTLLDGIE